MANAIALLTASLALAGCTPSEQEQPVQDCASLEARFPQLIKLIQSRELSPAVRVVQEQLLDTGLLQPALAAVVMLLQAAPPPVELFARSQDDDTQQPPTTVLRSVTHYLVGRAPAKASHYQVSSAIGATIARCPDLLVLADNLLNVTVPAGCTIGDEGCELAWRAVVMSVRTLVATPSIRQGASAIAEPTFNEEAFVSLAKAFTSLFKSPVVDFSQLTKFSQLYVLPVVFDTELRNALQSLFSTVQQVMAPELGIQAALASSLSCFEAIDTDSSVYRLIYTLVSDSAFRTTEAVSGTPEPSRAPMRWVGELTHKLRAQPAAAQALRQALGALLLESNASIILPALASADDAGWFADPSALLEPKPCL